MLPPEISNPKDYVRIVDESGEDYLYPASYFEPVHLNGEAKSDSITVHISPTLRGILHAEAVAAHRSVGALLRTWIDERLDLPSTA